MLQVSIVDGVGILNLDRPEARNALSRPLITAMTSALNGFENNPAVRTILLTGGPPFCAGADIEEMADLDLAQALAEDFSGCCDRLASCTRPVVVAVEGYALGGGCELVEMADIVVAAEDARFGHPEITLGTLSGAGGTQRLARTVGRAKAMDMILTGRLMGAVEAERLGLISRVVAAGNAYGEALALAAALARRPPQALRLAKEAVHWAVSAGLDQGLRLERRLFHLSFATGDLHQGVQQFLQRRQR